MENSLCPEHLADLKKSGLSDETIKRSGIYSVPPQNINPILGSNNHVNSLMAFPYHGTNFIRYKLFPAAKLSTKDVKPRRYYQPPGSSIYLYEPQGFDPTLPIVRICEGEKKALRGVQEGLNACAIGGVWNFSTKDENDRPELIEGFKKMDWRDKAVELVPDGDFQLNPSVLHAVFRLGKMLTAEGAQVKIVRLPGNSKLDDFLCTHSIEEFYQLELLDLESRIFRNAQIKEDGYGAAIRGAVLGFKGFLNLEIEKRPYILKPILRPGTLGMIYSPAGYGKTMLAISLVIAVTHKLSIGSWDVETPVKTLYVDAEMSGDDLQKRIKELSFNLPRPDAPLDVWSAEYAERQGWPRPVLTNKEYREAIYNYISEEKYGLVILDNKASLCPNIDENSKRDWDDIGQWMLALRFIGTAVILIHHSGKSRQPRGSTGVEDSLDFILKLDRPADYREEDGCSVDVSFQKSRAIFGLDAAGFNFKINPLPAGDGLTWTVSPKEADKIAMVIAMLGNGKTATETVKAAKISRQYVSRVRSKAIADGYLAVDGDNKKLTTFTLAGKAEFGGVDFE